jgi:hypothetical protein
MKSHLHILLSALVLVAIGNGYTHAADAGLSTMKNEQAAYPAGMGGAAVSLTADPSLVGYNPAAAAAVDTFTATFGHTLFWENIRFESGAFATRLFPRLYAQGHLRYAGVDDIEQRSIPSSEPEALFASNDILGKFGLAYQVSDKVAAGAAFGWAFEKISEWRGSELNFDLGVLVRPQPELSLGAAATGIGGDLILTKDGEEGTEPIPLPTTYRVGGSYRYDRYLGAMDIVSVDETTHLHLGAESMVNEYLTLRVGYQTGWDSRDFTAGASFSVRNFRVDYAFLPFTNNLGTSHLFNLTVSL